jgi:hypothetical protein
MSQIGVVFVNLAGLLGIEEKIQIILPYSCWLPRGIQTTEKKWNKQKWETTRVAFFFSFPVEQIRKII